MWIPNRLIVKIDEDRTYDGTPYFQVAPAFVEPGYAADADLPNRTRLIVAKSPNTRLWFWMVFDNTTRTLESSEDDFATAEEAIADFNGYMDSELFCYGD